MSFHNNLLSRKGRTRTAATATAQRQIAEDFRRAKAFDIAPPSAPAAILAAGAPETEADGRLGSIGPRGQVRLTPSSEPPFTIRTLAQRWGCSEGAVRSVIRNGELGHFRVGDLIRVPAEEVRGFECRR